ncbi:MAG: AraC family transcriptional regulator [Chloroflexota bacterium]
MYTELKPKYLSNFVDSIWFCDSDVDPDEGHVSPLSMSPQLVLKIYQTDIETVLSGPVTQQKRYPLVEEATYFGIQFAPSIGPAFDDVLLKDLKDTSIDIDKLLGFDLRLLAHQLQASHSWGDQSKLLERTLSRNYPEATSFLNQNVLQAMYIADQAWGNISIKSLAAQVGISKRHLERLFLRHIGVSPKTFCTNLRMQRVLDKLNNPQFISLAQLALECGYSDQSHLSNEFRRAMGQSILDYLSAPNGAG